MLGAIHNYTRYISYADNNMLLSSEEVVYPLPRRDVYRCFGKIGEAHQSHVDPRSEALLLSRSEGPTAR